MIDGDGKRVGRHQHMDDEKVTIMLVFQGVST